MKWKKIGLALPIIFTSFGCPPPRIAHEADPMFDRYLTESIRVRPIDRAIIAQHTLYPYHFVINSAKLNPLGERDLRVLAEHLKVNPGPLNLCRGKASSDLYQARVKAVVHSLGQAGVDVDRVEIADRLPGGEGMTSDRVRDALSADSSGSNTAGDGSGGTGSR